MRSLPISPPLRRVDPLRRLLRIPATQSTTPTRPWARDPPVLILHIQHFAPPHRDERFIRREAQGDADYRGPHASASLWRHPSVIDLSPFLSATSTFQRQSKRIETFPVASPTPSAISVSYLFSQSLIRCLYTCPIFSTIPSIHTEYQQVYDQERDHLFFFLPLATPLSHPTRFPTLFYQTMR
jgi:hypothetical protein